MKKVIYTVVVNGYDKLLPAPKFPGWDCICFTDGKRLPLTARLGLSGWKIVTYPDWGFDGFRYSRLPKILPHHFLPDHDYSVYIDGNAYLLRNPDEVLAELDWPDFVSAYHPHYPAIGTEFKECIKQGKSDPVLLQLQEQAYRRDGMPDDLQLMENNLLMRRHNDKAVRSISSNWWREMNRVSHRDQLSLPYVCWKQGFHPTLITQETKRSLFRTKSHFRTVWQRLNRSLQKRLKQA